jgi:hypothetical protein
MPRGNSRVRATQVRAALARPNRSAARRCRLQVVPATGPITTDRHCGGNAERGCWRQPEGVIEEGDARQRIADLKAQRLNIEAEIACLKEAPKFITLHPATLDRYAETADAPAASLADHAEAQYDRGPLVGTFRALVHSTAEVLTSAAVIEGLARLLEIAGGA